MKPVYLVAPLFLFIAGCAHNYRMDQTPDPDKVMYIGPELVDCTGVGPMKCMQVKSSPAADWELFYGSIDGFTYEPGFLYKIVVKKTEVKNPPADGSSVKYSFVSELEKERK